MSKRTLARRARNRRHADLRKAGPDSPPTDIPEIFCEPVFVIDAQPNGTHLSRALEMNVPVVILRTAERSAEERLRDFIGLIWIPDHPYVQQDYVGDPSNIPYFRTLWRDHVLNVKTRLAREGAKSQSATPPIPDWERKSGGT